MSYVPLKDLAAQPAFFAPLKVKGMQTKFHYVSQHTLPMGRKISCTSGSPRQTERLWQGLVRVPPWRAWKNSLRLLPQLCSPQLAEGWRA